MPLLSYFLDKEKVTQVSEWQKSLDPSGLVPELVSNHQAVLPSFPEVFPLLSFLSYFYPLLLSPSHQGPLSLLWYEGM